MNIAEWTLVLGWIFVLIWIPVVILFNRKTHPKALFVLFFAEIADKIFGFKKIIIMGGVLMMLGHFSLAFEGSNSLVWKR